MAPMIVTPPNDEYPDCFLPLEKVRFERRRLLCRAAHGVGGVALASLLWPRILDAAPLKGTLDPLPLPQRAKRVIWLTMAGGPSHLETFDYKPKLAEVDGQPMPESLTKGQQLAQLQGEKLICLGPQFSFDQHGDNGKHDPPTAAPATDRRDVAVDAQLAEIGCGRGHGPANEIAGNHGRRGPILPSRASCSRERGDHQRAINFARRGASDAQRAT